MRGHAESAQPGVPAPPACRWRPRWALPRSLGSLLALALALPLTGCPQDTPDTNNFASADGGAGDTLGADHSDAVKPDAGAPDTGTPDAGTPDAGTPDTGTPDAGTPDTGTPDTGTPDTGTPDTGTPDTGTPDTGTPDTGTPDTGMPDTGTPDTGTPDTGCVTDKQCDDNDPCTASQCTGGVCDHLPLTDWTSCGAGKQCTPKGAPGGCQATVRGSTWDIAAGDKTSCALLADGQVWCWGRNDAAQLPFGKASGSATGYPWPQLSVLGKTEQVALGLGFGCALDAAGKVRCWGTNAYGQLGNGTTTSKAVGSPTPLKTSQTFASVTLGISHGCALRTDGAAFCWGIGGAGQLGDGQGKSSTSPVQVKGLSGLEQLALGEAFTCARHFDGTAWCWGTNGQGQLGDGKGGTSQWSDVPVKVSLSGTVTDLAAGRDHACAITGSGASAKVWCWGANGAGQTGDGSAGLPKKSPVQVSGLTFEPKELSLGGKTSCAWQLGGKLACWGDNSFGQLATKADTAPHTSPVPVQGVLDLKELVVGETHVCARIVADQAACWGHNYSGQVGGGSTLVKVTTPTIVGQPAP